MVAVVIRRWIKLKAYVSRTFNAMPEVYGSIGFGVMGMIMWSYGFLMSPPQGYTVRYKERYMVVRPDDERLINYPKEYVTDNYLLK